MKDAETDADSKIIKANIEKLPTKYRTVQYVKALVTPGNPSDPFDIGPRRFEKVRVSAGGKKLPVICE